MGESECRNSSKAEIKKQETFKNIIQSYKRENIAIHLKGLALNMGVLELNMQLTLYFLSYLEIGQIKIHIYYTRTNKINKII